VTIFPGASHEYHSAGYANGNYGDEPGTLSEMIKNLCHWMNDQRKKGQDL